MPDVSKDKSRTPTEAVWWVVRTAVTSGLIPVWVITSTRYAANHDPSLIWAGITQSVAIAVILGGGVWLGLRTLRRRKR